MDMEEFEIVIVRAEKFRGKTREKTAQCCFSGREPTNVVADEGCQGRENGSVKFERECFNGEGSCEGRGEVL